jgi:hypothetical protein
VVTNPLGEYKTLNKRALSYNELADQGYNNFCPQAASAEQIEQ